MRGRMTEPAVIAAADARRCEALGLVQRIKERYGVASSGGGPGISLLAASGVDASAVNHWERGAAPRRRTLSALRAAANGPPRTLFALLYDMYRDEHGTQEVRQ